VAASTVVQTTEITLPDASAAATTEQAGTAEQATVAAAEAAVAILDIPLAKAPRQPRKISTHDAEQILDSVLEALPEPKQPGQGRSRVSRRVSSPVITTDNN
jgi:ribonuclease E